ncbi:MAG: hypothetical protein GY859_14560 [Desulfobacterales bacterium]|nr:hypothetical protein [Desulfobacterales bacterium]
MEEVSGIVIGTWEEMASSETGSGPIVRTLVEAREKLPDLKGVFLGDVIYEESEISWIQQSDMSPLLAAFPELETLRVRGNENLSLGDLKHPGLKSLIVETGGLSGKVVRQVASADLPELEHLELWLGVEEYGGDAAMDDLAPILSGTLFPKLRCLGLRDSIMADDIARAISNAPILRRIRRLDLSLGALTDEGGKALLDNPGLSSLESIDLHHHYLSNEMMAALRDSGLNVNLDDQQEDEEDEEYRYPAVTE